MSFEELNLKKFFPNNLINIKNKVLRTWDNIDKYKSDLDLKKIISKILENVNISYSDFSAVIYNIKKVEVLIKNEDLAVETLLSKVKIDNKNTEVDIIGLFEDIYEVFIAYYKNEEVEKQLNRLIDENIDIINNISTRIEIYKEYTLSNDSFFKFLFINIVKNGLIKNKWEEILIYYGISEEREIFLEITNKIFGQIVEYIKFNKDHIDAITSNLLEKQKLSDIIQISKKILSYYSTVEDTELFSDIWMRKISKILGHPDKNLINWEGFLPEEINTMKRWLVKNQLEEIFTIEVKDKKRLEFWKRYISYIKKVEFYKDLNQAIIMETVNHTFIEFGEKGNAFYVYDLENLNIKSIESFSRTNLWKLKNRGEALLYLAHSGSWENKFALELQYLGYEIKGKKYGYYR